MHVHDCTYTHTHTTLHSYTHTHTHTPHTHTHHTTEIMLIYILMNIFNFVILTIYKKCITNNIVYLPSLLWHLPTITIHGRNKEYTQDQHRSNINKNTGTLVTKHFNQTDHSIHNMKCVAVEKVLADKLEDRLRREAFWIQKLKTLAPCGLNTLD